MGRFWDIIPPYRPIQTSKHHLKRQKSKNTSVFLGLIIIILVGGFIYSVLQNTPVNVNGVATISPQKSITTQKSISSPTEKNPDQLLIKILNGTGQSEETSNVTSSLEDLGFSVTKTENALSLYDQTIIYFESHQAK